MIAQRSRAEIEIIRSAGNIAANTLKLLSKAAKPGITTLELNNLAEENVIKSGGVCAFKGYKNYPSAICASINEEIVHGIPSERMLKNGDILSLDVGVQFNGYCADAAVTVAVGQIDARVQALLSATQKALALGIKQAKCGKFLSDISYAIQSYVESLGFSVVRQFVGHGIGKKLHEEPEIPNFGRPGRGPQLKSGMILAIEPMVNMGTWEAIVFENGWTAATADSKPSAHFEHTIALTDTGPVILTL